MWRKVLSEVDLDLVMLERVTDFCVDRLNNNAALVTRVLGNFFIWDQGAHSAK